LEQYKCPTCSSLKPGRYEDGDSGEGGVLPLCPTCLGTGFSSQEPEFVKLKANVAELRDKGYDLLKGELSKTTSNWDREIALALLNGKLLAITSRAYYLVAPAKKCYSAELIKSYCMPKAESCSKK